MGLYLVTATAPRNAQIFTSIIVAEDHYASMRIFKNQSRFIAGITYHINDYYYEAVEISIPGLCDFHPPDGLYLFSEGIHSV
jgi:hypothetical protein